MEDHKTPEHLVSQRTFCIRPPARTALDNGAQGSRAREPFGPNFSGIGTCELLPNETFLTMPLYGRQGYDIQRGAPVGREFTVEDDANTLF